MKTNVMFISYPKVKYGAEKCLIEISRRLDKQRFRVSCVVPHNSDYKRDLEKEGANCIEINTYNRCEIGNIPSVWKMNYLLINAVKKAKTDIVHFNMVAHIASFTVFILWLRIRGVKIIFHQRTPNSYHWYERILLAQGCIICVSHAIRQKFLETRRSDFLVRALPKRTIALHDGIDFEELASQVSGTHDLRERYGLSHCFVVGMVAAIHPVKNLELLIEIAAKAHKRIPNIKFLYAGGMRSNAKADIEYLRKIESMVRDNGLEDVIIFTGYIDDVKSLYEVMDLSILTSHHEPFGLVLVEAMYFGVPCISAAVEGPKEILEEGKSGYLVNNFNADEFAEKIVSLFKNERLRKEIGDEGRRRALTCFGIQRHVDLIESLYSTLLGKECHAST